MNWVDAFILGLIQGVTEFFPISSSAHLYLTRSLLLHIEKTPPILFDLACHLGTLLVLLIYFRREIKLIFTEKKSLYLYLTALLPLIPAYLLFRQALNALPIYFMIALGLLITACLLLVATYCAPKKEKPFTISSALTVGVFQCFALFPGISRSGITITAAICQGISAKEAVTFSFLLSIPAILGGVIIEIFQLIRHPIDLSFDASFHLLTMSSIGFAASFILGGFLIHRGISLIERKRFLPFALYCLIISTLVIYRAL